MQTDKNIYIISSSMIKFLGSVKMPKKSNDPTARDGFRLLMNVGDTIEAGIIESKLKASGIDTIRSNREQGDLLNIILGKSFIGVDILVPEEKYEEAKRILESSPDISGEEVLTDGSFTDESAKAESEAQLKKLGRYTWIMMSVLLTVIAAIIVLALILQ